MGVCLHVYFADVHHMQLARSLAVRQKAKELIAFIQDDEKVRQERKTAKTTRDKYVGLSSEEMTTKYSEWASNCFQLLWYVVSC